MVISIIKRKTDIQNDKKVFINAQFVKISDEEAEKIENLVLYNRSDLIIILKNYDQSYLDVIVNSVKKTNNDMYIVVEGDVKN